MALLIRVFHKGEPVPLTPIEFFFDKIRRYERYTDKNGEVLFELCPGSNVRVTVNGKSQGTYTCEEDGTVDVDI